MSEVICSFSRVRVSPIVLRQRRDLSKGSAVRKFRITAIDDKGREITTWSELKGGHAETRRMRRINCHTATCKGDLQVQIAELFQTTVANSNLHLKALYAEGELAEAATIKSCLIVRSEGARQLGVQINFGAATLKDGLRRIVNNLPTSASPRLGVIFRKAQNRIVSRCLAGLRA